MEPGRDWRPTACKVKGRHPPKTASACVSARSRDATRNTITERAVSTAQAMRRQLPRRFTDKTGWRPLPDSDRCCRRERELYRTLVDATGLNNSLILLA